MLTRNRRSVSGLAGLTLAALLALPVAVLGNTSGPIAQTGGMTATLPLIGSPLLTVAVTLDVVGNISNVDLIPVGTFSASQVGPHAVSFETIDGTVQVKIKARGDKMSTKTAASSLDSLVGSGTWSADVFGPGTTAEVAYTISAPGGMPTLTIDSVAATPTDVTVVQQPVETKSDDEGSSASARIDFSFQGFVMHLKINVSVRNEGDRPASLSFELSGKDKQKLSGTLAELVGSHSWTGFLCDGTPATVNFTVNAVNDVGTVSFVSAVPATPTATVTDSEHGFTARFDGTRTEVKVKLVQNEDGTWTLKVDAKTDKCEETPALTPTVNTPVLLRDEDPDEEDSDHDGDSDDGDSDDGDSDDGDSGGDGSNGGSDDH